MYASVGCERSSWLFCQWKLSVTCSVFLYCACLPLDWGYGHDPRQGSQGATVSDAEGAFCHISGRTLEKWLFKCLFYQRNISYLILLLAARNLSGVWETVHCLKLEIFWYFIQTLQICYLWGSLLKSRRIRQRPKSRTQSCRAQLRSSSKILSSSAANLAPGRYAVQQPFWRRLMSLSVTLWWIQRMMEARELQTESQVNKFTSSNREKGQWTAEIK